MNQFNGMGNLGSDAEFLAKGNVLKFSIAINDKWKDKDGKDQERTEWVRCAKFGKGVDKLAQYLKKGDTVGITGQLRTSEFEKDGEKRYSTEVIVDRLTFGGKSKASSGGDSSATKSKFKK